MVAKSYQKLKQLGVPYKDNGKAYVRVMTQNGVEKVVRWYDENEYAKMYPEEKKDRTQDPYYKPQKYTLGFDKGYITIFRGYKEELHEDWFRQSICRFTRWWGWYVISTQEVPKDLPPGLEPVKLYWDPMGNEEEWLKEESVVLAHVQATLYPTKPKSVSQDDEIGDRIEKILTIEENIEIENKRFNSKTNIHYMRDSKGNLYMWKTSAKNWPVGTSKVVRGTIKEFDTYKGEIVTILTRCIEQ